MFGKVQTKPQNENTPFYPLSLMVWLSYMHIGLLKIIEKHIKYLHPMVYYLITKVLEERLCNKKIVSALCKIKEVNKKNCFWKY